MKERDQAYVAIGAFLISLLWIVTLLFYWDSLAK